MKTKEALLEKGIKRISILLGLLIISPITLNIGFKALNRFTESPKIYIGYGIVFIGISLLFFTVYFAFKTFKTFLDALFNKF